MPASQTREFIQQQLPVSSNHKLPAGKGAVGSLLVESSRYACELAGIDVD